MRAYNLRSALQKPEFMTGLYLNRMDLEEIPLEVFRLSNLKELDLRFNKIEELPAAIGQLKQLERLVLSNNLIGQLPFELGQLQGLREIRLENNRLADWPEILHSLPQLEKLNLSHNQLEIITEGAPPFKHLRELYLASNQLKKLPVGIGQWQALRSLDLSDNDLGRLPLSIGDFLELDHLNLANNRLRQLPLTLSKIETLRFLNIDSNQFTEIPEVIFQNRHLRHLTAVGNRISQLPEAIVRLQWLSYLDLSRNQLKYLPEQLETCTQLQVLLLEKNALAQLPSLTALNRLDRLNINDNQLKALPLLPPSLKTLTLSRNLLTGCPSPIGELHHLEILDLSYNAVTALPENFHQLQRLEKLDLRKTTLTEWPVHLIQLNNLKTLQSDCPVAERKTFFRLLQAFVKAKMPPEIRWQLFQFLTVGPRFVGELSLRTLFWAANLKHVELRRLARAELFRRHGRKTVDLKAESHLCIIGKTALARRVLTHRLSQQKIRVSTLPANDSPTILLGEFPDWSPSLDRDQVVYLTEAQVIKWLDKQEGRYLRTATGENLIRLRELLLHEDPINVQLAVQLMQGGGMPPELLTELLIAWKKTQAGKLRQQIKQLLWQYTPESARAVLELPLSLSLKQPKELLEANIKRLCAETPFEEEKIRKYGRL